MAKGIEKGVKTPYLCLISEKGVKPMCPLKMFGSGKSQFFFQPLLALPNLENLESGMTACCCRSFTALPQDGWLLLLTTTCKYGVPLRKYRWSHSFCAVVVSPLHSPSQILCQDETRHILRGVGKNYAVWSNFSCRHRFEYAIKWFI